MGANFTHLTMTDRIKIETLLNEGKSKTHIAGVIGKHKSTISRELGRGVYTRLNSDLTEKTAYSPDIAQDKYRANLDAKGADLKIGKDRDLSEYLENKIIEDKFSPAAALAEAEKDGKTARTRFYVATFCSYITKGVFLKLTNKDLPVKRNKTKHEYKHVRPKRAPKGDSIEKRPAEISECVTFGNWEMDSVKGKRDTKRTLLVLTERLTRNEIIIPMRDGTDESTVAAINGLETRFGAALFARLFNSITVDNGSEFADCTGIETSINGGKRTKLYYCHPYSSWERGSNENQNKMIRRFIPKGTPIENYTDAEIADINKWINDYPRKLHKWRSANELYNEYLAALTAVQPRAAP